MLSLLLDNPNTACFMIAVMMGILLFKLNPVSEADLAEWQARRTARMLEMEARLEARMRDMEARLEAWNREIEAWMNDRNAKLEARKNAYD
jgi:hypothetical protein